jgi:ASC-1-like (ASCH) protein
MKSWTLRFRATDKEIFEDVRSGKKSVETRAATVKFKPIEVGDDLVFSCDGDKFSKRISKKEHFKSIDALVKKVPFKKIMPAAKSIDEMKKVYSSYSGYDEKIKEFGIFAFYLK